MYERVRPKGAPTYSPSIPLAAAGHELKVRHLIPSPPCTGPLSSHLDFCRGCGATRGTERSNVAKLTFDHASIHEFDYVRRLLDHAASPVATSPMLPLVVWVVNDF